MCGILGIVSHVGAVDVGEFQSALGMLWRRGPDQQGQWVDSSGKTALGTTRLAIIGNSARGSQPIVSQSGNAITYNGEIYNYAELASRFGISDFGNSDTEVLANLVDRFGVDAVKLLEGMFAFAVWNPVSEELFLVRDRFGIKPLYYYADNEKFIFSSEIKSILGFKSVSREIDQSALYDYFTYMYVPTPKTPFRRIRKLTPGSYLLLKNGQIEVRKYWDLNARSTQEPGLMDSRPLLTDMLKQTVKSYSCLTEPFGVLLSGGVDSSLLLALLKEQKFDFSAFSIGFDVERHSELHYAVAAAQSLGVRHYPEVITQVQARQILPNAIGTLDEPLGNCSLIPSYHVHDLARRHDVRVLISGEGGDEIFGGYNWYTHFLKKEMDVGDTSWPLEDQLYYYLKLLGGFTRSEKRGFLHEDFVEEFSQYDELWHFRRYWDVELPTLTRLQYLDLKTYLPDDLLTKSDRLSAHHSQETRFPYLNHHLVEFLFRLPLACRNPGNQPKYLQKQVAGNFVPSAILQRDKKGFSIPFYVWVEQGLFGDYPFRDRVLKAPEHWPATLNSLEIYFLSSYCAWRQQTEDGSCR